MALIQRQFVRRFMTFPSAAIAVKPVSACRAAASSESNIRLAK
jgi:hypothetical protein